MCSSFDLILCHGSEDFLLTPEMAACVKAWIRARCSAPSLVAEGWLTYGAPGECRLNLVWEEVDEHQLHIHLDVDAELYSFVLELCCLARLIGCELYSPEFEVCIPPVPSALIERLMCSQAWFEAWGPVDTAPDMWRHGQGATALNSASS